MTRLSGIKTVSAMRRSVIAGLVLLPALAWAQKTASKTQIEVWKTPACGCCRDWLLHLRNNGFEVVVHDVEDTVEARQKVRMPARYASCHTGLVQGYALDGHVPAREIRRLLRESPYAIGLAVPSMPIGAPGMDSPAYDNRHMPYNVLLVGLDGNATVFQPHK